MFYCLGVCLELLGMAFMATVIVVFFGQVDARLLLSLTAVGMLLFYSGWFCVRQGSRPSPSDDAQRSARG
jgi:L-asparagine transporter-like permease